MIDKLIRLLLLIMAIGVVYLIVLGLVWVAVAVWNFYINH